MNIQYLFVSLQQKTKLFINFNNKEKKDMKRPLILLALVAAMPLTMNAQDDMYFVPTKKNVEKAKKVYGMPKDTYYSGSDRSVDDYNRRNRTECWEGDLSNGSQVVAIDSLGNEIATVNVKKKKSRRDSLMTDDDYTCTRRMARWDGYECSNAYWHGYNDGRFNRWYGWSSFYDPWYYSPWYGSSYWYDPWYYDPWYYGYTGWYGGWYGWRPYYSYYYDWGWHGHYYPVYGGGGSGTRYYGTGRAGTANHGGNSYGRPKSAFGSGRSISSGIANRDRTNSVITRSGTSNRFNSNRNVSYRRDNINTSSGNYQHVSNSSSSRSSGFSSGSSFGGSRSGGISAGGSRSGGSISRGGRR